MVPKMLAYDTVTRIRPGTKTERGSVIPDWDNATTAMISGVNFQPASTTLSQDGRVLGISESCTCYMPYTADIQEGDRLAFESEIYTVIGAPMRWRSPTGAAAHTKVNLERWQG